MGRYRSVCFGLSFMTPKGDIVMKVFGEGNNREMEVKIRESGSNCFVFSGSTLTGC